jgi:hypothetical protein
VREEMAGTFTVAVKSWRFASNDVETTVDPSNEKWILLEYPLTDDPEEKHTHAIPLSGVAFRMEILGLSDPNEALDITIKELNIPEENDVKGLYPKAVEVYYDSSTKIARALMEESMVPSFRARNFSSDDFVGSVRELLRGGNPPMALRAAGESPLGEAVSRLASSRNSAVSTLRAAQEPVAVEETDTMRDLRSAVGNLTEEIIRMTDEHAHRAMENGAYYYARMMERKGS